MGCGASRVCCPTCGKSTFRDGQELVEHLKQHHLFGYLHAPVTTSHSQLTCKCEFCGIDVLVDKLAEHLQLMHIKTPPPVTKTIKCPKCFTDGMCDGQTFLDHLKTVHRIVDEVNHATQHIFSCPMCSKNDIKNADTFLEHLTNTHAIAPVPAAVPHAPTPVATSPSQLTCKCGFCGIDIVIDKLDEHLQLMHIRNPPPVTKTIKCPKCFKDGMVDGQTFLDHLKKVHRMVDEVNHATQNIFSCPMCSKNDIKNADKFLEHLANTHAVAPIPKTKDIAITNKPPRVHANKKLPRTGDRVLAMWGQSKWQYFHATVVRPMDDGLRYEIEWDDGGTTGLIVDYYNIAVDKVPEDDEIGIESIILFPQGKYKAGASCDIGGQRWHQGKITNIFSEGSKKYYSGVHTKSGADGKFVTYRDYCHEFTRYTREEFRVGPNVFDILDDAVDDNTSTDDVDIYFSCTRTENVVSTNLSAGDKMDEPCNPFQIAKRLTDKGLKLVEGDGEAVRNNLMEKVNKMKHCKVFIACICDDYVTDEQCRMEFQYAKSTLRKPVIPIVTGNGTEWTMSVVGMLIAGELYIHFKDKSVEEQKFQEVLRSLSTHISSLAEEVAEEQEETLKLGPGDVFISYCWSNSLHAKENNQISRHTGTTYSDPRFISKRVADVGYSTWLDIERLKSADQNAGLYEQLTEALKSAKLVVPCISDEYAASINCQMEFQFSVNTLQKHVIPIIVGTGSQWKKTVVGSLLSSMDIEPICFQSTDDEVDFSDKFTLLTEKIALVLEKDVGATPKSARSHVRSRAPNINDRVICHYYNYSYYMATVVSWSREAMEYTVAWDDGDDNGTVQPFNQVSVDVPPEVDDIGVGSVIFFPQGEHAETEGSSAGSVRYHEGIISNIKHGYDILVDGYHTRKQEDGKCCDYEGYSYEFYDIPIHDIRIAPTALETFGIDVSGTTT